MGRVLRLVPVRWWLIGLAVAVLMLLLLIAPVVVGLSALFSVSQAPHYAVCPISGPP